MPIKDKSKYPKDWKQIRARILERAGHKCEQCGVMDRAIGFRDDGRFIQLAKNKESMGMEVEVASCVDGYKVIEIVLTIAHYNHDTSDNSDGNLFAWCQRCHNRHDVAHRQANAAETRRLKKLTQAARHGQFSLSEAAL